MTEDRPDQDGEAGSRVTLATLDLAAVARIASRVRLTEVRMARCATEVNSQPRDLVSDWGERAFIGFDSHLVSGPSEAGAFVVESAFLCVYIEGLDADVDELPEPDPDAPADVLLDVDYHLSYTLTGDDPLEPRDLDHFAVANATHNAWPYWREIAQSFTQRMAISPIMISPFKIASPHDPED